MLKQHSKLILYYINQIESIKQLMTDRGVDSVIVWLYFQSRL